MNTTIAPGTWPLIPGLNSILDVENLIMFRLLCYQSSTGIGTDGVWHVSDMWQPPMNVQVPIMKLKAGSPNPLLDDAAGQAVDTVELDLIATEIPSKSSKKLNSCQFNKWEDNSCICSNDCGSEWYTAATL